MSEAKYIAVILFWKDRTLRKNLQNALLAKI